VSAMNKSLSICITVLLSLFASVSLTDAQDKEPLRLVQTIPLAFDAAHRRVYVALVTLSLLLMRGTTSAVAAAQPTSHEAAPLQLIHRIPLPGVSGRIDFVGGVAMIDPVNEIYVGDLRGAGGHSKSFQLERNVPAFSSMSPTMAMWSMSSTAKPTVDQVGT
jgi:hypothetical protein